MTRINKRHIVGALTSLGMSALLVACGGGNDGNDAPLVSGSWSGNLTLTSSTCNASKEVLSGAVTHTVNQNEDAVILVDSLNNQYLGNTVGDNGFSVNAVISTDVPNDAGTQCDTSQMISYNGIESSSDPDASVRIETTESCDDQTQCQSISQGILSRTTSTPPPAADPDPEVAFNGCGDVREITFTGDSGCGIQETELTFEMRPEANALVLEPFGGNGASSFIIGEDPFTATSVSTDLTILGESGYRCSVNCEGRLRFSLNCFKEGAPSCDEVF